MLFQGSGFSFNAGTLFRVSWYAFSSTFFLPIFRFLSVGVSFALLSASHLRTSAYSH